MRTIPESVKRIVENSVLYDYGLREDILNISSVARKIKPIVENDLRKEVDENAVAMALRRIGNKLVGAETQNIADFLGGISDVMVRSDLTAYTFLFSPTLIDSKKQLLTILTEKANSFCTFSQGIAEVTVIINSTLNATVDKLFGNEKLLHRAEGLSAITIKLPDGSSPISGIYQYIFRKVANERISVLEVISTTNEFTMVVEDENADRMFTILKGLKQR